MIRLSHGYRLVARPVGKPRVVRRLFWLEEQVRLVLCFVARLPVLLEGVAVRYRHHSRGCHCLVLRGCSRLLVNKTRPRSGSLATARATFSAPLCGRRFFQSDVWLYNGSAFAIAHDKRRHGPAFPWDMLQFSGQIILLE